MAYTKLIYHIIFRPHDSQPVINEEHEKDLYMYVFGFCKNHDCKLFRINGMPDHLHLCVALPPTVVVADFVHDIKIATGNFMRANRDKFPHFVAWARGYCALTYSEKDRNTVCEYIRNQKNHHRKFTWREEYIAFLQEAGIEYDERYL